MHADTLSTICTRVTFVVSLNITFIHSTKYCKRHHKKSYPIYTRYIYPIHNNYTPVQTNRISPNRIRLANNYYRILLTSTRIYACALVGRPACIIKAFFFVFKFDSSIQDSKHFAKSLLYVKTGNLRIP